jgi:hypothetical protein
VSVERSVTVHTPSSPCGGGLGWGEPSARKSTPTISSPIEEEGKNGNSRERLQRSGRGTIATGFAVTVFTGTFILSRLAEGPSALVVLTFVLAFVAAVLFLFLFQRLMTAAAVRDPGVPLRWAHVHFLLHVFPLAWLIAQFFILPSRELNLLFFAPVALFFWTGRRTWKGMNERFEKPLYRFFVKGNTGLLISLTVLTLLGLFHDPVFGGEYFRSILCAYLAGHLLIVGPAIVKIKRDLLRTG